MSENRGRQPAEGVRILKAEEAQAALDAGEAAGRRPDDQLRYGDVPPAPAGPRPAHRFPLPDTVDPAEAVSLPPLAPRPPAERGRAESGRVGRAQPPPPPAAPSPVQTGPAPNPTEGDDQVEADAPPWAAAAGWPPPGADRTTEMGIPPAPSAPDESITVSGSVPEMPHWTDPPTGEVPRLRFDDDEPAHEGDDMAAWRALGSRGVRWRDENDWEDAEELSDLAGDEEPVGALDQNRTAHSDLYSFDEDFERVTNRTGSEPVVDLTGVGDTGVGEDERWAEIQSGRPTPGGREARGRTDGRVARRGRRTGPAMASGAATRAVAPGSAAARGAAIGSAAAEGVAAAEGGAAAATRATEAPPARRGATAVRDRPTPGAPRRPAPRRPGGGDMGSRVAVGAGLIVLLIIAYAVGAKALLALAAVVVVASAAEAYNMTRAPGFRPATLLGLVATVGCVLGAYWKGIGAIPVVTVLLFTGAMLWYVLGVVEARPLANVAVTVMVFVWVSVLGSFSAVLLRQSHGTGLFLGGVVVAVAADICAFAVGRWIGSHPMAASISPNKTIEGFLGGIVGALIVGAIVGKELTPWGGMRHGLILGLVIGLIAPVGDLFESMLKRDLGIKDSGRVLGGHGGLLDRFDGILLALPAAYFVATIAHL